MFVRAGGGKKEGRKEHTDMAECGEETLVYMPDRTVATAPLSASLTSSLKRPRSREDSSELCKSDCYPTEILKHRQEENGISNSFEFEIPLQNGEIQNSDVPKRTPGRAKRTKCVYVLGNACNSMNSSADLRSLDIPLFPSTVDEDSLNVAMPVSSKSIEYGAASSSDSHLEDSEADGVSKPSGVSKQKPSKRKPHTFEQSSIQTTTRNGDETVNKKKVESLDYNGSQEATLVDVQLTVEANNRAEDVPFVSLKSKLTGREKNRKCRRLGF
ncbi:uncharacterized protein LOC127250346 isoform X2 [Andrographis paniculata]|uniref:uncharacterized protein LOC127250346 isoform X2 n=1 Tax=Andrographis paniculata TaxID=175694 RepID=UPI0021E90D94|nr:uncharacterized protein LOC127250346 isoform X2 [Andrographis paniculata]